ncbi:hypothetical protein PR048_005919 [Dryococelus australis]|uniref:Uncharacterized protein n=1 Tax=Dryococelus australis TaxID=614101 RepID=A0ABQ9I9I3_9NEOP|nr:hypothetical protein PR048_005919 [Dryococelus australis]
MSGKATPNHSRLWSPWKPEACRGHPSTSPPPPFFTLTQYAYRNTDSRLLDFVLVYESLTAATVVAPANAAANMAFVTWYDPGRGIVVVRLLAFTKANRAQLPARLSEFSHLGNVADLAFCRRIFSGLSSFPRPCIPFLFNPHLSRSPTLKASLKTGKKFLNSNFTDAQISPLYSTPLRLYNGSYSPTAGCGADDAPIQRSSLIPVGATMRNFRSRSDGTKNYLAPHDDEVNHIWVGLCRLRHEKFAVECYDIRHFIARMVKLSGPFFGAAVAQRLERSLFHVNKPGSIPGGVPPGFLTWESCRMMPLVDEFSRGSPVSRSQAMDVCCGWTKDGCRCQRIAEANIHRQAAVSETEEQRLNWLGMFVTLGRPGSRKFTRSLDVSRHPREGGRIDQLSARGDSGDARGVPHDSPLLHHQRTAKPSVCESAEESCSVATSSRPCPPTKPAAANFKWGINDKRDSFSLRHRLVRRRSGVWEVLGLNPRQGIGVSLSNVTSEIVSLPHSSSGDRLLVVCQPGPGKHGLLQTPFKEIKYRAILKLREITFFPVARKKVYTTHGYYGKGRGVAASGTHSKTADDVTQLLLLLLRRDSQSLTYSPRPRGCTHVSNVRD